MPNQDDDEDILGTEDAEELPPEIAARLAPSVAGNPYAAIAAAATASKPQPKSIAGPPPAPPAASVTDMPRRPLDAPANVPRGTLDASSMPPTGGPLDMPATAPSMPGVSGGRTPGPNLSQDVLSGNVAPPNFRDYRPAHVGLGKTILASALGGLAGMKDPNLGAETYRSIAYGPQERQFEGDTEQYKGALEQGKLGEAQQAAAEKEKHDEATDTERGARAANETSEAKARDNPADKQDWSMVPDSNWEINKTTGETRQAQGVPDRGKLEKPDTIEMGNGTFQWDGKAWNKIGPSKKTEGEASGGTWSIEEDAKTGKSILMNSKTGQTKDANGLEKPGTAEKAADKLAKGQEPIKAAEQYAEDYLQNGQFTGPGDEALQEKFFELAKPSTGFRMSQPQMQMLKDSRSWKEGTKALAYHALTGQWYTPTQREQIVSTMKELAAAKMATPAEGQPESRDYNGATYTRSKPGDPWTIQKTK